ncbi:MAG: hypothetical protein ACYC9S_12880, partial [Leptospirales bacterium]
SILEVRADFRSVRVHVRQMSVANLFCPARLADFGGKSYMDLDWTPPRNIVGTIINADALRRQKSIEESELAAKTGDPTRAIALLRQLTLPNGSYERALILTAAVAAENWQTIIDVTDPPLAIGELIQRVDALSRLGKSSSAMETLDRFSMQLDLPETIANELRHRVAAQKTMRQ